MGILAPLYLAGLAALSLPILFHLVRRTPRGRQEFSSLMFLSPTPPQLTRRSRLDQILLLLLRAAALAILAFAFARPFLRESATLALSNLPSRRVAILLDTSGSMRRGDLWQQAQKTVDDELNDLNPHDEVALYTFGDRLTTVVDFKAALPADAAQAATQTSGQPANRVETIRKALKTLKPGWSGTDLGSALVTVAGELDALSDVKQSPAEPQILLVSDMQRGAAVSAVQSFEWPSKVRVVSRRLEPKGKTNAVVQPLRDEEEPTAEEVRVRVVSAANSTADQFHIGWGNGSQKKRDVKDDLAVYVPPGQSRVVKLQRSIDNLDADRIIVRGDDQDFDNAHYVVPLKKQHVRIVFVGDDTGNDPQGLHYYLKLAVSDDPFRQIDVDPLPADAKVQSLGVPSPQVVVLARAISPQLQESLGKFLDAGGIALLVASTTETAQLAAALCSEVEVQPDQPVGEGKYLLLGEIDFSHPLFKPFAAPKYSDFTKIHFWDHRSLALKPSTEKDAIPASKTRVAARFDNGEPAVLDREIGQGHLFVLASGWTPDDSQLALSGKFVPLMASLVDVAAGPTEILTAITINAPAALPTRRVGETTVIKPDGKRVKVAATAAEFTDTDLPGTYRVKSSADETLFAVNVPLSESDTAPFNQEQLEQQGVRFGQTVKSSERLDRMRQQRDTELESRQKVWRWLIVGALALLIFETWLAGRTAIPRTAETVPA